MMMNLFSMFDPSSSMKNMVWIMMVVPMLIMTKPMKNKNKNPQSMIKELMLIIFYNEMKKMETKSKSNSIKMITITGIMIMLMNTMALYPYVFTYTAHMSYSFMLALSMWMAIMIFSWSKSFKFMVLHLLPVGTPSFLMNFMVIIEIISNLIRPITLSIRLSANMVAGHLLILLLMEFSMNTPMKWMLSTIPTFMLATLEIMVCLVQSYVLVTLMSLYQNESMK